MATRVLSSLQPSSLQLLGFFKLATMAIGVSLSMQPWPFKLLRAASHGPQLARVLSSSTMGTPAFKRFSSSQSWPIELHHGRESFIELAAMATKSFVELDR
ncbi:hypothetical protein NL676_007252 [Syzygium grande]|nr:hypothetical protein NL676_007252 [Syzygium grande]